MATDPTQKGRLLTITPPDGIGEDHLLLVGFTGSEGISTLFRFYLDLLALNKFTIPFEMVLGQKITVHLTLRNGKQRHFSGICSRFSKGDRGEIFTSYQMEVVPKFWTLTKRSRSRIFQNMTVPKILEKVLTGLNVGLANGSKDLSGLGEFEKREYCVQYRETDFNFASRLMEEEGIRYFFEHTATDHKLILAVQDAFTFVPDVEKGGKINFHRGVTAAIREDAIFSWTKDQELRSGKVVLRDNSFELPGQKLEPIPNPTIQESVDVGKVTHKQLLGSNKDLEIYDFPGYYAQRFDGVGGGGKEQPDELKKIQGDNGDNKRTAKIRMEQEAATGLLLRGAGNVAPMAPNFIFKLQNDPDGNGAPYRILGVSHSASLGVAFRSGDNNNPGLAYQNTFICTPVGQPYRPARVTPKPFVQGPQTAIVVGSGASGEEIFTDKFGRVKVEFHWDRTDGFDAGNPMEPHKFSSCWVRVAQSWAGKRWGSYFVPRIGQELVIAFLEGDPDQPIAVGAVYNAEQMPPYLGQGPDAKHRNDPKLSGIKTNTTPGGKGFNELRFDDTKDKQQVFIHAERDLDTRVKNETREVVLLNRHLIVGNEEDGKGDQRELVIKDKHQNVKGSQVELIEGDMLLTVGGNQDVVVKHVRKQLIEEEDNLHCKSHRREQVDQTQSLTVGGDLQEKVGMHYALEAGSAIHLKAARKVVIEAGTQLTLKVGGCFIDLSAAGIAINGVPTLLLNSGGAPGEGDGSSPVAPADALAAKPTKPDLADNSATGFKSVPNGFSS
jgi:type VI secretion system secreted protein VgrG